MLKHLSMRDYFLVQSANLADWSAKGLGGLTVQLAAFLCVKSDRGRRSRFIYVMSARPPAKNCCSDADRFIGDYRGLSPMRKRLKLLFFLKDYAI
jgi:hypothetical protein